MERTMKKLITFKITLIITACIMILMTGSESKGAIDLVTVPKKDEVQLTIYNSADITMVRESRTLTFKKGHNTIQFAWKGTLIDPTSLRMRFLSHKTDLDLLDTTYPPNRKDALQWNIKSSFNGPARVEITYFTSGITWSADYVVLSNENESKADLTGYVTVINNSGEDYPNAKVRLVVGTINLVESISTLAKGRISYSRLSKSKRYRVRRSFRGYMKKAEELNKVGGSYDMREKKIVKEGLSEYFIFSIEGRETVNNRWKKRMKSVYVENIPLNTIYRLQDKRSTSTVFKYYEFKNKKFKNKQGKGQLGESPLPDGFYRVFIRDNKNNLIFQREYKNSYVATGDKVKLQLGRSKDIIVRRTLKDYKRFDITIKRNYYKHPYIKNYKERFYYETEIINTLKRTVKIEIERRFYGKHWVKNLRYKSYKVNKNTFKYFPKLFAGKTEKNRYEVEVFRGSK